ncbi:MAG: asparagine synthase (glutamine-hydrolyzing) [Candidatus Poribacteria bacterium]|nr:asparagine synthase (glutamine-hydrolyzing) [Candidatus Poribacteria bacterium]
MCGVVGYLNGNGAVASEEVLARMMLPVTHRGPDDSGKYVRGSLGLGHLRLSILDLSLRGSQPFITADAKGVLAYNGEVYNFQALRKALEKENVGFKSTSDTEVVLNALHFWGPERAIPQFNGIFAFAYFDERDKTLWLARDRLGIKPLYIAQSCDTIIFASEIKSILRHPDMPCRPNMLALTTHLVHEYLEGTWSAFEGVESIAPGSILKIKDGAIREIQYFDVIRDLDVDRLLENHSRNSHEIVSDFEEKITTAVHSQLVSDTPVATFCSGGIDSSFITAVSKDVTPNLVAYVASVEDALPEAEKAKQVTDHLGIELRNISFRSEDYLRGWAESVWLLDQPPVYVSDQILLGLVRVCREDGFKVLLSGTGADELFGGYPWHADAHRLWRWQKWQARGRWALRPLGFIFETLSNLCPIDPITLEERTFARWPTPNPQNDHQYIREACAEDGAQRALRYKSLFEKLAPVNPVDDRALLAVCLNDLYGHILNLVHRDDRMGMGASVEIRVPFLDNTILDYAMHLPAKYKYFKGKGKRVLKSVATSYLPDDIVHGPKTPFSTSYKPYKAAMPLVRTGMVPELFNWSSMAVKHLMSELVEKPTVFYSVVGVELWARMFLRGETPVEIGEKLVKNAAEVGI